MKLDLDFGDVGAVQPEGCWRVLINSGLYKKNKAGDGYIIEMDAETIDMPDEKFDNMKVFPKPNVSLKPSARWKLQEVLSAITGEDWSDDGMELEVDEETFEVPVLAGKTVLAIFIHDTYNNRVNAKIDTWIVDDGTVNIGAAIEGSSSGSVV